MRRELAQSLAPCFTVGAGLALFAIPASGIAAGSVILNFSIPVCEYHLAHIIDLQRVYNDPPDFDYEHVVGITPSARTPIDATSCDTASGADRKACRRIAKAATKYAGKVQRVGDVTEALRITVERASAALLAGDEKALNKQLKAGTKRGRQLDAAVATRARFGAKLAATLGDAGISASLTETQFGEAVQTVLGRLAAGGLPEADARAALGPALTPTALDPLTVLGQP
jgi:hypothetical protein